MTSGGTPPKPKTEAVSTLKHHSPRRSLKARMYGCSRKPSQGGGFELCGGFVAAGSACRCLFLKTRPTKYGSALAGCERHRSFHSAFRADCLSLCANWLTETGIALRLALLAAFRIVHKLFVVKERLLTSRKHKLCPTLNAFQLFVNKNHTPSRKSANERERLSGHTIP